MGVQIVKQSKGTGKYKDYGYMIYPVTFNNKQYIVSILGGSESHSDMTSIRIAEYTEDMNPDKMDWSPVLYEDSRWCIPKYYIRNLNAQTIKELIKDVFQSYQKHLTESSIPDITLQDWDEKIVL